MGTDDEKGHEALLQELSSRDWSITLDAVRASERWCQARVIGDQELDAIVTRIVGLARHRKWEVRRAVANVAAQVPHPAFDAVLAALLVDDNSRVRQAAEHAALRRRDSRSASTLGKQHSDRLSAILDEIEARFGTRGREAVRRAGEQIANTFARELYHEVIRLMSPIAMSADRLRDQLSKQTFSVSGLRDEADRLGRRVTHLRAVLDGMRAYAEQPVLAFGPEDLREMLDEAAALVKANSRSERAALVDVRVPTGLVIEVSRSRLVQALTNVMENAVESYERLDRRDPVAVSATVQDGLATITIQDTGCGMSPEATKDAVTLFATSKPGGTGFGLPLAVKIVEDEHGGRLDLESSPDLGTSVRITIRLQR